MTGRRTREGRADLSVQCYSGTTYAEDVRGFTWKGQAYEVVETERRWRTPGGPRFRVRTSDGQRWLLAYDEAEQAWGLSPLI
jgi:hypothetical protein